MNESLNPKNQHTISAFRKPSSSAHLDIEDPIEFDLKVAEAYRKSRASEKTRRPGIEMLSFAQLMTAH